MTDDGEGGYANTGYEVGIASQPHTIFGGFGSPIQVSRLNDSTFSVLSLRVTPVWKNNMTIKFKGYIGEFEAAEQTVVVSLE